nr:MAG TPA: RRM in Demeter [Bacteriophage sp.]
MYSSIAVTKLITAVTRLIISSMLSPPSVLYVFIIPLNGWYCQVLFIKITA